MKIKTGAVTGKPFLVIWEYTIGPWGKFLVEDLALNWQNDTEVIEL